LGVGGRGLGPKPPTPNPQSPIPNPPINKVSKYKFDILILNTLINIINLKDV